MSHSTFAGMDAVPSQSQSLSQQPEVNLSEAFEIEEIEDEVEIICNPAYTIPSSFKGLRFGLQIIGYLKSRPLHRRILELRSGVSLNPSFIKKQKRIEFIKRKLSRNRSKVVTSTSTQTQSLNHDENLRKQKTKQKTNKYHRKSNSNWLSTNSISTQAFSQLDDHSQREKRDLNCDSLIERDTGPSSPLSMANLEAFTSMNNPHSIPQKCLSNQFRGSNPNYLLGLKPPVSFKTLEMPSPANSIVERSYQSNQSLFGTPLLDSSNSGDHLYGKTSQGLKRKIEIDSNDQSSFKRQLVIEVTHYKLKLYNLETVCRA
ncbi:uncharacterized protein MELLADRAFT_91434 [Melampsora larici-populina 98AG31]|uniref:Uncharacterized protein n=1 Tax=Melampsora larici-populina (strain 98AG31 / pathotype 3-4-7) TaxID=747676 RepID=F4RZ18_MELLP|nr:uncharacterized protein MELLADRAFT_91434 [Melampsora larici-populina 98AG31]EGG02401.1 hypothetical protein MELLADRAFT_91434 [Melampsora larici-populina 98AG31]